MPRASQLKVQSTGVEGIQKEAKTPKRANGGESGLFVASVEKAFRVLDLFKASRVELGLSEVAAKSGIGKSAAQRFLHRLQILGAPKKPRSYSRRPIARARRRSTSRSWTERT